MLPRLDRGAASTRGNVARPAFGGPELGGDCRVYSAERFIVGGVAPEESLDRDQKAPGRVAVAALNLGACLVGPRPEIVMKMNRSQHEADRGTSAA